MIEPKELRIGNFIYSIVLKTAVMVQWPHPAEVVVKTDFIDHVHGNLEEFTPIKISPEILEKIEQFQCQKNHIFECEIKYGWLVIGKLLEQKEFVLFELQSYDHDGERVGVMTIEDIKYLHQLQNFYYAHTGQELTITL